MLFFIVFFIGSDNSMAVVTQLSFKIVFHYNFCKNNYYITSCRNALLYQVIILIHEHASETTVSSNLYQHK